MTVERCSAPARIPALAGRAYDQRASVTNFEDRVFGVEIEVEAKDIQQYDEFPDGFRWTQTVRTNARHPDCTKTSPYVDPCPNGDDKPFYWTDAEEKQHKNSFYDWPHRPTPKTGVTDWDATLCLMGVDEKNKSVKPFDCLNYGWSLDAQGDLKMRRPVSTFSNYGEHRSTLESEFPDWYFSLLKHR
jgi:hypothetical protein